MARSEIVVKSKGTGSVKLSPAPILPAMSFELSNQLGSDVKVIVDGKKIRLEPASS
jgi:hypothetical protein